MISPKKLMNMAMKWQRLATIRRKTIAFPRTTVNRDESSLPVIDKGHFVVYTADQRRFVFPLAYLKNEVFRELLKMAEEEYGLHLDGPIILPLDSFFMEYAISLIQTHPTKDIEKALLTFVASGRCVSSSYIQKQEHTHQHILIRGF